MNDHENDQPHRHLEFPRNGNTCVATCTMKEPTTSVSDRDFVNVAPLQLGKKDCAFVMGEAFAQSC